ncbi:MAG: hypothetical protein Q4Q53_07005 [Methanocorpusculum sp.]|nr:hypothetical protein [Methanocorpusculum sp.]
MNKKVKSAPDKDALSFEVEGDKSSPISLSQRDLFFSDEMIQTAAIFAYWKTSGTTKSIRNSDVYDNLGMPRGCTLWERRQEIIPAQRISRLLKKAGFVTIRNSGAKARYILQGAEA